MLRAGEEERVPFGVRARGGERVSGGAGRVRLSGRGVVGSGGDLVTERRRGFY